HSRRGVPRLEHAEDAEGHILGGEVVAIPPLHSFMEMEDVDHPPILHLPMGGQIPNDLAGVEGIKLNYLVIHGADSSQRPKSASQVRVPNFRVGIIEHHSTATVYPPRG